MIILVPAHLCSPVPLVRGSLSQHECAQMASQSACQLVCMFPALARTWTMECVISDIGAMHAVLPNNISYNTGICISIPCSSI